MNDIMWSVIVYRNKAEWEDDKVFWSEDYETEDEANEVARIVSNDYPGSLIEIFCDVLECDYYYEG